MKLYKYSMIILSLISFLNATSLKEMIQSTLNNNENIKSLDTQNKSKQKIYDSVNNTYTPTITAGINYTKLDFDTRAVQVGATTTGFIKIGVNIYDGGKSSALKKQKHYEYKASLFSNNTLKKETLLQVITTFFKTKTIIDNIKVYQEKSITLKAQYDRIKTKFDLQMATQDEVLKLKSEYEINKYTIEELKYQKEESLEQLSLFTGKHITQLDNSKLPDIENLEFLQSDNIKSLNLTIKAQEENAKLISSINKPHISIENNINFYNYNDYNERILTDLPNKQNQFNLKLTYNIFDTSSKHTIESAKLSKLVSQQKLNYIKSKEKINFNLAKKKLHTQKRKIASLKIALNMAQSVYDIIKIKYQNGIVDNITYLDALGKKIYNLALYKQALNNYEIYKAYCYFNSGMSYNKVLKLNF